MKTVAFKTLGCKVNTYETESIYETMKADGYKKVDFNSEADVYVINTCTVTNTGDKKSRQAIRRCIRQNPDAIVAVVGCYSQMKPEEVRKIEGVDIILGTQGRDDLLPLIKNFEEKRQPIEAVTNIMKQKNFENMGVVSFENQTRAFIKIQEGCNNFCTFCIIPWARGLIRSQSPEKVIAEVKNLVNNGIKEIVLTGIHTGGYGEDLENYNFAMLLKELDSIENLERIRISSIEISQIDDEVLEVLKNSHKIVNHLHVPIQAGSSEILHKMRRHYDVDEYKKKINELREIFPDISITTDIIVGFPGETEELFEESLRTVREVDFAEMHVFPYSIRSGTPAARMDDQIDERLKKERVHKMIDLNNKLATEYAKNFEGDIVEILVERINKSGNLEGHTSNYLKVEIPIEDVNLEKDKFINQLVNVELIESNYPKSIGKLI